MVAAFTGYFASQRVGFASVLILLGLGVVLMLFVKEERAAPVAEATDTSGSDIRQGAREAGATGGALAPDLG